MSISYHRLVGVHVSDMIHEALGLATAPLTDVAVHDDHIVSSPQMAAVGTILKKEYNATTVILYQN